MNSDTRKRLGRAPLLMMAMVSLVAGIYGGLVRLPLNLPLPSDNANWLTFHGPLMVCGFLGTVIGLERAVGLKGWWNYLAPLLTGMGALMTAAGTLGPTPVVFITLGSIFFWGVTLQVVRIQPVAFTIVMSAGTLSWAIGNVLWWKGWGINQVVPWWIAFLALTILGERLDLSRFRKPSRWSTPLLGFALVVFSGGILVATVSRVRGEQLTGAGLVFLAAWLWHFDLARRTIKQPGLSRFMASCLLAGYVWMAVSGILMIAFSPLESGFHYDAVLHSFFLGFVFSMIFGHAPVIFPAVLMVPATFRTSFYSHVVLLHLAIGLRVIGDLAHWAPGKQWGGTLNAAAIAVFLFNTVVAFARAPSPSRKPVNR